MIGPTRDNQSHSFLVRVQSYSESSPTCESNIFQYPLIRFQTDEVAHYLKVALFYAGRHPTVIRIKMSALHVATSHFYHDSYFRRFRSVYKLTFLLVTFCLWFVVVEVATKVMLNQMILIFLNFQ